MALKIGDFVDAVAVAPREVPLPQRWYLLRVHPHKETKVLRALELRGANVYLPTLKRDVRARLGGVRRVISPFFPGLLFLPDFELGRFRLRDVEGVIGLFQMDQCTPFLSSSDMAAVRALEAAGNVPVAKLPRLYAVGQIVRVVDGPFSGWQGRIERLDSKGRLRVLVGALKRGHKVQMTESQIEPAPDCDRSGDGSAAARRLRRRPN